MFAAATSGAKVSLSDNRPDGSPILQVNPPTYAPLVLLAKLVDEPAELYYDLERRDGTMASKSSDCPNVTNRQ